MAEREKISVIIPAYNVEKYISKCIDSVLQQSYYNIEIIIVDDGSHDNTPAIIDRYADKDNRIKTIHQINQGLPAARNAGLKAASGDFIMFLDSDDWIESNCCKIALKQLLLHKADMILFDYYREFSSRTEPCYSYKENKMIYNKNNKNDFSIYNMKTITAWGKLYTRKCLDGIMFNENMRTAEDVDFNYRVYNNINSAVYIRKTLLHYRMLESSAIHGFDCDVKNKFEYPINSIKKYMICDDAEKVNAYYSFLAIAFIVICQNGICLDTTKTINEKVEMIKNLKNELYIADLFENTDRIKIPFSRKTLILMGKYGVNIGIILSVALKQKLKS
ncbi:MAG: glycosyltransferase family 2 protein [Ruminococcus sp.]|nr:glycosyltransferase family 2 protein [Ruminococcus sp.]